MKIVALVAACFLSASAAHAQVAKKDTAKIAAKAGAKENASAEKLPSANKDAKYVEFTAPQAATASNAASKKKAAYKEFTAGDADSAAKSAAKPAPKKSSKPNTPKCLHFGLPCGHAPNPHRVRDNE